MTTIAEQLKAARKLIEREDAWCKGAAALDAEGSVVPPDDVDAVAWSAVGALERDRYHYDALRRLGDACGRNVVALNDDPATTHADVLATFDRAIERAEQ